jgi:hypothetical protein
MSNPRRSTAERPAGILRANELVYPIDGVGPHYGDGVWDFTALIVRESDHHKSIDFESVPEGYRQSIRDTLVCLAQPTHPRLVAAGVVRRRPPAPPVTLIDTFSGLRVIAWWGHRRGLSTFGDWTQEHAVAFLDALRSGEHREGGTTVGGSTIRHYVEKLKLLREVSPALGSAGLTFQPWGAQSTLSVAGHVNAPENKTQPLPWETWAPLIAASWVIVDKFSVDILESRRVASCLPLEPRGPAGTRAWALLENWANAGGRVPLHTGEGHRSSAQRGLANTNLLFRLLGLNASMTKSANRSYRQEAVDLIAEMAQDPARSAFGGLMEPRVQVTHPDGTVTPWIAELGMSEVLSLESVLRAACYVLIASLTGMRDSEIQSLTRDTVTTRAGLPALSGRQFKGVSTPVGVERGWWAPAPIFRVIEVLAALSIHDTHLLARSAAKAVGAYRPARDIPRLIAFVNDEAAMRIGRGAGLGLARIHIDPKASINATSLRRSFSVFASTHPGAELGLGIQLGHAAWRMTTGYTTNDQQTLAKLMDADRVHLMRAQASALVVGTAPMAGRPSKSVLDLRAQVVADPGRAERIINVMAERLHLGTTNDCMFDAEVAACGPQGPFLGDHICSGINCGNALYQTDHAPALRVAIDRIDRFLERDRMHPSFIDRLKADRTRLAAVLSDLDQLDEGTDRA